MRAAGLDRVARRLLGEELDWDLADDLVVEERAQLAGVGDVADDGELELPLLADRLDGLEPLGSDDGDHPLLALGDHDLDRRQVGLAQRDAVEVDVEARAPAPGHLGERGGEAGRAEVLQRLDEPAFGELEAGLDQLLPRERVADLDGRALVLVLVGELLAREDAGAADAVAARRRAVEDDEVARAGRARAREALGREEADAHRVDERVRRGRRRRRPPRRRPWGRRRSCRSGRCRRRRGRRRSRARRSGGRRAARPGARPWRRCREGCRRPRSRRPGRARPRTDGCGSRP